MMMLVLGIGGLEKRTTPTLLHDEKTKKNNPAFSSWTTFTTKEPPATQRCCSSGYVDISREVKDISIYANRFDFLLEEKRDV